MNNLGIEKKHRSATSSFQVKFWHEQNIGSLELHWLLYTVNNMYSVKGFLTSICHYVSHILPVVKLLT